jgi:protein ImuB
VLRRYRHPIPVRVTSAESRPVRFAANRSGIPDGAITICAGPWRTSGEWWSGTAPQPWDRDEWEVALEDGTVCRIFQDRTTRGWFLDGLVD